ASSSRRRDSANNSSESRTPRAPPACCAPSSDAAEARESSAAFRAVGDLVPFATRRSRVRIPLAPPISRPSFSALLPLVARPGAPQHRAIAQDRQRRLPPYLPPRPTSPCQV